LILVLLTIFLSRNYGPKSQEIKTFFEAIKSNRQEVAHEYFWFWETTYERNKLSKKLVYKLMPVSIATTKTFQDLKENPCAPPVGQK